MMTMTFVFPDLIERNVVKNKWGKDVNVFERFDLNHVFCLCLMFSDECGVIRKLRKVAIQLQHYVNIVNKDHRKSSGLRLDP